MAADVQRRRLVSAPRPARGVAPCLKAAFRAAIVLGADRPLTGTAATVALAGPSRSTVHMELSPRATVTAGGTLTTALATDVVTALRQLEVSVAD